MNKKEIEKDILKDYAIGIDYGKAKSQSAISREIEILELKNNIDNGIDLATRTYRVYEYIIDTIKENGEISQFKEDVLYIIHGLLERQLPTKKITATQIVIENRDKEMQLERERYMKSKINKLEQKTSVLDKVTKTLKRDREIFDKCRKKHEMYSPSEERMNTKYHYTEKLLDIIEGERNDGEIIRNL